ncbi:MAG: polyphosphate kinase 2 family protein [Anaerolineaceae bacterium]|nr:polyphosphate kinase 2 family protein [Anaerolineaceae bacterium]
MDLDRYVIKPDDSFKLKDFDPEDKSAFNAGKQEGAVMLQKLSVELETLQAVLYAEHKQKILMILQAMDTGGKDGTIRRVFAGVNPQGVRVASFKAPTSEELDHDFLWRVHQQIPAKGEMVVFNRSHYEDVLIVRVHQLVPEDVWKQRYRQINDFEQMLSETGTTILKFFLNIDQDEQKKRLEERLKDPVKRWKFNPADLRERECWQEYMDAYEDAIRKTSTDWAPWVIVPANHNWYRDLIVSSYLVEHLESLKMKYPNAIDGIEGIKIV